MRQFLERVISLLTVLLAAFAVAHLADAQTLPDPDPQATQVERGAAARLADSGAAGRL